MTFQTNHKALYVESTLLGTSAQTLNINVVVCNIEVWLKCGVKGFPHYNVEGKEDSTISPVSVFNKQKQTWTSIDKTIAKLLPPSLNGCNLKQEMFHLCPDLNIVGIFY